MSVVAVFDVGKTNVKLFAVTPDGEILESISAQNTVHDGPPYRHHDLAALEAWLLAGLKDLGTRHAIGAVVACAHGSGGVLAGEDGPALPMVDYEQPLPADVEAAYPALAGTYRERGSAIMLGSAHIARQMLWQEMHWPQAFAKARAILATPQYWAWRLSGVLAGEVTSLAAQSHLWSPADGREPSLIRARGWSRLMPPMRRAWETLGPPRPEIAAASGLKPDTRILCGIHDSSANFYRYQAAGLSDLAVVSTGTWIVLLTDRTGVDFDVERPGHACNADVFGRPMPGMLTMGGREFAAVAGGNAGPASGAVLRRLVESGTMALPTFGSDDGLFPGTARRGRIVGPLAEDAGSRFTLAVLHAALLTVECLGDLPPATTTVLDGNFVKDSYFGAIVSALLPGRRVLVNQGAFGTATGAALLAGHESRTAPAPLAVETPNTDDIPDLTHYRAQWRARSRAEETAS